MKTVTVQEAQLRLAALISEAIEGELIVLTDGEQKVTLQLATGKFPFSATP
jgi:antitoxin (DNA-binding transcriptional repressor) of toxin-antitoxin stability system